MRRGGTYLLRGGTSMLRRWGIPVAFLALYAFCFGPAARAQDADTKRLTARGLDSGFELSNGTFNGMLAASDGKIYYVLCAENIDTGAQMYSYDPATDKIQHLGDLTEAAGKRASSLFPKARATSPSLNPTESCTSPPTSIGTACKAAWNSWPRHHPGTSLILAATSSPMIWLPESSRTWRQRRQVRGSLR